MQIQGVWRWRSVVVIKGLAFQSVTVAASIHSTTASSYRQRNNNNNQSYSGGGSSERPSKGGGSSERPSKNYIRFETRQKRADTKKALKGLLFNDRFQDYFPNMKDSAGHSDRPKKKSRAKSSTQHASKARQIKRKLHREGYTDDEHSEPIFHATFGNKSYSWSYKSWGDTNSQTSTNEFEWREHPNSSDNRNSRWQNPSDVETDDEPCSVGSLSDRRLLGLPSEGPLKIEDVKNAFRLSAFKWHPDKHQGPSQETAEEKFKLCLSAYKSLCSALSSA